MPKSHESRSSSENAPPVSIGGLTLRVRHESWRNQDGTELWEAWKEPPKTEELYLDGSVFTAEVMGSFKEDDMVFIRTGSKQFYVRLPEYEEMKEEATKVEPAVTELVQMDHQALTLNDVYPVECWARDSNGAHVKVVFSTMCVTWITNEAL